MTEPSYQSLLEECVAYHGHLCMGQCLGVRVAAAGLEYLGLPLLPASQRRYRDLIVVVENDRCIADAVAAVTGARLGRKTLKVRDYGKQAATLALLVPEPGVNMGTGSLRAHGKGEDNHGNKSNSGVSNLSSTNSLPAAGAIGSQSKERNPVPANANDRDPARLVKLQPAVRVSISESFNHHFLRYCQERGWDPEDKQSQARAVLSLPTRDFLCLTPVSLELPRRELPGKPERVVNCARCGERVMDGKEIEKDGLILCWACAYGAYYATPKC